MGRPKKVRVHFAGVASAGASSAAAAAAAAEFGLPGADADGLPRATDSWSSEDDDEAAEFRREAAELLKQKQRQKILPGGLQQKQLDNAIKHFVSQTGISKAEAEDALLATAEQHCQDFENWVNEALVWLAVQGEVQDEAAKLKEAMEVSLREQEAARQAEEAAAPPLANLSEERLRKRFQGSALLARLGALLPGSVLFSDRPPVREQVKHKLVEFLRLEADCMKWWPSSGTKTFFDDLAGKVHDELSQASSSNGSVTGIAASAGAGAGAAAAAAALSLGIGQTAQGPTATALPALGPLQASVAAAGHDGAGGLQDSSADAAGGASAGAAAAAAAGPGSCRQSPESDVLSDPCSSAADDDSFGAASTGLRASTRKRQPPARYRSPSPATGTRRKRPQQESPDCLQAAKRHASLDCHAAAAHDSMTARRSASPSPACVETKDPGAPDNMQQRDGGGCSQRPQGALPPLPPLQQHLLVAQQQQQQWQQQRLPQLPALQPAVAGAGISAAQASMVACLSQLLDEELQHIRRHVFNMPEKACAVPIIFQSPEEQQPQQDAGDDSDVELVDVKAPQGLQDIPDPVEPPAATHAVTPPHATAAAAAAAAGVPAAAAAAAATVASGLPAAAAGMAAALQGTSSAAAMAAAAASAAAAAGPSVPAATGAMLLTPRFSGGSTAEGMGGFPFAVVDEQLHYRATTNEQGTLVIEID